MSAAPSTQVDLSIVVPVYFASKTLRELVARTDVALRGLDLTYEYVFVDDGSKDGSWEVLAALASEHDNICAVRLMRNFGQHNALMCGLKKSRGEFVVTLDDDLQNPPEEIPRLYEAVVQGGHDVVFGYFSERSHNFFRNFTSKISRWLFTKSIPRLNPFYSNYRIIRRCVVDLIISQQEDFLYTDGLITWATDRTSHISVVHAPRVGSRSNYTLRKLLAYFSVVLFTFTVVPLRVVALTGSFISFCGFVLGAYFVYQKLVGNLVIEGFAGVIVSVLVIGGIQLLSLAIIGEYVGKIFLKQSGKPQFAVRETCGAIYAGNDVVHRNEKRLRGSQGYPSDVQDIAAPRRHIS